MNRIRRTFYSDNKDLLDEVKKNITQESIEGISISGKYFIFSRIDKNEFKEIKERYNINLLHTNTYEIIS